MNNGDNGDNGEPHLPEMIIIIIIRSWTEMNIVGVAKHFQKHIV